MFVIDLGLSKSSIQRASNKRDEFFELLKAGSSSALHISGVVSIKITQNYISNQ